MSRVQQRHHFRKKLAKRRHGVEHTSQLPRSIRHELFKTQVLDLMRQLFDLALKYAFHFPITHIERHRDTDQYRGIGVKKRAQPTLYKLDVDLDLNNASPQFHNDVEPRLKEDIKRWNLCDIAAWLFVSDARRLLGPIGYQVDWLHLRAVARHLFVDSSSDIEYAPLHSILRVSKFGSNLAAASILDPTIRQFGWAPETELLRWNQYCKTVVLDDAWECAGDDLVTSTMKVAKKNGGYWDMAGVIIMGVLRDVQPGRILKGAQVHAILRVAGRYFKDAGRLAHARVEDIILSFLK